MKRSRMVKIPRLEGSVKDHLFGANNRHPASGLDVAARQALQMSRTSFFSMYRAARLWACPRVRPRLSS